MVRSSHGVLLAHSIKMEQRSLVKNLEDDLLASARKVGKLEDDV